jgi:hypothetical protein
VKKHSTIVISLVMLTVWLLPRAPALAHGVSTVLKPDPLSLGLAPEVQGMVAIVVENVPNLYGLEFHLTFNPNIVEVVDADPAQEGVQIEPADWWKDGFVAVNQADNQSGRVDFAATLLGPTPPVRGNRTIAVITFVAKNTGVSALRIESAILSTRDAEEILYTKQEGG